MGFGADLEFSHGCWRWTQDFRVSFIGGSTQIAAIFIYVGMPRGKGNSRSEWAKFKQAQGYYFLILRDWPTCY